MTVDQEWSGASSNVLLTALLSSVAFLGKSKSMEPVRLSMLAVL